MPHQKNYDARARLWVRWWWRPVLTVLARWASRQVLSRVRSVRSPLVPGQLVRLVLRIDLNADVQQLEHLDAEPEPAGLAPADHVGDEREDRQDHVRSPA
jgi:hypothetical protein